MTVCLGQQYHGGVIFFPVYLVLPDWNSTCFDRREEASAASQGISSPYLEDAVSFARVMASFSFCVLRSLLIEKRSAIVIQREDGSMVLLYACDPLECDGILAFQMCENGI